MQNRSYRYVAPNGVVGAVTGYQLPQRTYHRAGNDLYLASQFRRTTQHRLACARHKGIHPYES